MGKLNSRQRLDDARDELFEVACRAMHAYLDASDDIDEIKINLSKNGGLRKMLPLYKEQPRGRTKR